MLASGIAYAVARRKALLIALDGEGGVGKSLVAANVGIFLATLGKRVVLVDDLLATGGTMAAAIPLLEQVGAVVPAAACIIELNFLNGRKNLDIPVETLVNYDE